MTDRIDDGSLDIVEGLARNPGLGAHGYDTRLLCAEVREHREMVKRLEEWADLLDASGPGGVGPFIAAELRARMEGMRR